MQCLKTRSTKEADIFLSLLIFIIIVVASGTDYYCDDGQTLQIKLNDSNTSGTIHTLLEGETTYGDNRRCTWVINGGPNKRIHLQILSTELQWAPESAICTGGYDYVRVKDGISEDSPTVALWCGSRNPRNAISNGQTLTIVFQSNSKNQYQYSYKGAQIGFQTFDDGTCPPEWTSPMNSDPSCYKVMTHPETWVMGQMFCNYNQANLAEILNAKKQDFIKGLGEKSRAWIGLNKIASESEMKWITGEEMSVQYFASQDHLSDEDCVFIDFDTGEWQSAPCSRLKVTFVCQTNKGGPTPLYKVPEGRREVETQANIAIILAGLLGSLVVVGTVIAAIVFYLKCKARNNTKQKQDYTAPNVNNQSNQTSTNNHQVRNPPRPEPTAPREDDVMGTQLMFLNSHADPRSLIAPPTYDEAISEKDPVYL